jgi:hypothetical protein
MMRSGLKKFWHCLSLVAAALAAAVIFLAMATSSAKAHPHHTFAVDYANTGDAAKTSFEVVETQASRAILASCKAISSQMNTSDTADYCCGVAHFHGALASFFIDVTCPDFACGRILLEPASPVSTNLLSLLRPPQVIPVLS